MPFKICDRYTDENVTRASTWIDINTAVHSPALVFSGDYGITEQAMVITTLSAPNEIPGGSFFIHETHCIIVNGKNQILRLGGQYRFPINLYRSFDDPN